MNNHRKAAWTVGLILPITCNLASATTDLEKEALITPQPSAILSAEPIVSLGSSTNFVSPAAPLPPVTTPHDGINNDGGWTLVNFCLEGATGSGPASGPDCHHNDDDSSSVNLPFVFTLYGTPFTKAFINNNGNLSFGQLYSTFTATGFPVNGFPMVAPFWGDVDTGDQWDPDVLGHVWYKFLDGGTLAVSWDNVGYYNEHADKLNTFQVIISDGNNPSMGIGNNVCFAYDDMQWTTGDASGGVGGFGGTAATVGANAGDGVNFFQLGRFDKPGNVYDGPGGANDGVDYLDGIGAGLAPAMCFNASGLNVPPIPVGFPSNNTVTVQCDSTLNHTVSFLSPEIGQQTAVSITDNDGAQTLGLVITNSPGNTATVNFNWAATAWDVGTYTIGLQATDNGTPSESTNASLTINVECPIVPAIIDVKPGSDVNPINRKSKGVIPVAILGSDTFDVTDVITSSLKFGTCGDETAAPAHDPVNHYEDVNGDGYLDLVSHYNSQDTNFAANAEQACLIGQTSYGQYFSGLDVVRIIK